MAHTEQDRIAYNETKKENEQKAKIENWLSENPEIGVLNNGNYYRIDENRNTVNVEPLQELN